MLNGSRAGFYKSKHHLPSCTEVENEDLSNQVAQIFKEHKERYGSRRFQFTLMKVYQLTVSRRRSARLLHAQGLLPQGTRRKVRRQKQEHPIVQRHHVNQNFKVTSKNKLWFGDITYILTAEGTLYLSTYLDAYSRRVVSYRIECHMRDELVIDCLEEGIRKEKPKPGLVIHGDQGSQYTGHRFFEVTQRNRFILSHSQKGNPYDNAVMKSYYRSLKRELLEKYGFKTKSEARLVLVDYLDNYYNQKRIHSSLNYLTPNKYVLSSN